MRFWSLTLLAFLLTGVAHARGLPNCRDGWRNQDSHYRAGENYEDFYRRLDRPACEKEWTVLVYMAADNNLFPFALADLYEMEAAFAGSDYAGSGPKTDILVQVDGTAPADLRRLHIFSGEEIYREKTEEDFANATLDQVKSPVAARLDEKSAGPEQKRLTDFLLWGAERYPAKNYMVIVWGHGQGWKAYPVAAPTDSRFLEKESLPTFPAPQTDSRFGGIAFRESDGSWLDIPALRDALASFHAEIGRPVDVYASDSCLMQMLEVAYELADDARFVVGSSQVQSFLGLPYRRLFYELNSGRFNGEKKKKGDSLDRADEPLLLAQMIPNLMRQSLDPRRGLQGRQNPEAQKFMTSSALSTAELRFTLMPAMAALEKSLENYLAEDDLRALDLQFVTQNVPNLEGGAQDVGIFFGYLNLLLLEEKQKTGLSPAAADLLKKVSAAQSALDRTVLAYAYGSAYGVDERTQVLGFVPRAVSLWLPVATKEYLNRRQEFLASRFYRESAWQAWLDVIFPR